MGRTYYAPKVGRKNRNIPVASRLGRKGGWVYRLPKQIMAQRINQTYTFTRTYQGADIIPLYATAAFYSYNFKLSDLPNYTEFSALFDFYRIDKVIVKFFPQVTVGNLGNNLTSTSVLSKVPRIVSVIDYDDSTALTNLNDAYQYQNMKQGLMTRQHNRVITPKVSTTVYKTAITSGYSVPKTGMWIDCTDADVPHYGLKIGIEQSGINGVPPGDMFRMTPVITFKMSFRQVR